MIQYSLYYIGMPGIQSFLGQSLDPFSIFGLTRQNWYEGPNVCIERKVINEEGDETVEEDAEVVAGSMRHGKYMKYVLLIITSLCTYFAWQG